MTSPLLNTAPYSPAEYPWASPMARLLMPLPMAGLATLLLLYAMHSLVHTGIPDISNEPRVEIPDVLHRYPDKIPTLPEQEKPVKPMEVELPPSVDIREPVEHRIDETFTNPGIRMSEILIKTSPGLNLGDQPMPIVRINPAYPASAVSRGVEGYVDVLFDITSMGTTSNIRIVGYSPSKVFNNSVLKAVRGWKYKPAGEGESAKKTVDVRERITFVMEK
ncbi:energy transducer TonB [Cellvibrio japonicus]|uniref:Protein TonB n=1 Tax=Cellvibrio japonicus (strain Ueda107) TaxID=498211 RepID=B3PLF8_CELJU|nr:energy transducer TonB [Cellvibrio japonicus]ACE82827.1 TonB2 [Cellvibrio japonicus Ueda107]QEI11610.1 TonB family protein [Cellvibrio japonicus]QEI15184.1 TonB family protein [Cellvibrio japonicus]QEI18764.1 TonB family protein [Cellvibrio japonicus]